jgi:hypothetical protein
LKKLGISKNIGRLEKLGGFEETWRQQKHGGPLPLSQTASNSLTGTLIGDRHSLLRHAGPATS